MPAIHLIGYEQATSGELTAPAIDNAHLAGEHLVGQGVLEDAADVYLFTPTQEPVATDLAEVIGAQLNLHAIEFEPVTIQNGSRSAMRELNAHLLEALAKEDFKPNEDSRFLAIKPRYFIAHVLGVDVQEVQLDEAYLVQQPLLNLRIDHELDDHDMRLRHG